MVIDTYSRTARPAVRTIATEPYPMTPLTIPDGLGPVPTSSDFATDRRGLGFFNLRVPKVSYRPLRVRIDMKQSAVPIYYI